MRSFSEFLRKFEKQIDFVPERLCFDRVSRADDGEVDRARFPQPSPSPVEAVDTQRVAIAVQEIQISMRYTNKSLNKI